VIDDGRGFAPDDLALAFTSHATSKLSAVGDLDHIASLGFRGEALASVGSISRSKIQSRAAGAEAGTEVRSIGGQASPVQPCGCPVGTVVEVRDLFYNTPARRKFLRSPQAEKARIQDLLVRLALPRLDVDFTLMVDGRRSLRMPKGETLQGRLGRAFGTDVTAGLLQVQRQQGDYQLTGLIAEPDAARKNSTLEVLYVNGRPIRERSATHAIRQAYRDFLMHGRFPAYFLMLALPPDQVDVNVHPTKAEVRFAEGRRVAGFLHESVRMGLLARGFQSRPGTMAVGEELPRARSGFPDLPQDLFARPDPPADLGMAVRETPGVLTPATRANPFREWRGSFLQIMDLYLLFEGVDGLVVVDQHALHERVLYERFKNRNSERKLQIQRLLTPEVIELGAEDKAWLLENAAALAEEGFLVDDFGGSAVAVQGLPAVLGNANPRSIVETFLSGEGCEEARPRAHDVIVERFHSMACRAAVMSGDRLSQEEIQSLLEEAAKLEHPHNCPHGRPTVLTFTAGELERYFKRR
jgi:DNA mismatch repair protein MutL